MSSGPQHVLKLLTFVTSLEPEKPMSMTRKHFQVIADNINEVRRAYHTLDNGDTSDAIVDDIARNLAAGLRQFNPNFNRQRFLEACGVED